MARSTRTLGGACNERLRNDPVGANHVSRFLPRHTRHWRGNTGWSLRTFRRRLKIIRDRRKLSGNGLASRRFLLHLPPRCYSLWFGGTQARKATAMGRLTGLVVVAQLISRIDAVVTRGSASWETDEIRVGYYEIKQGLIQMRFASGVTAFIEAHRRVRRHQCRKTCPARWPHLSECTSGGRWGWFYGGNPGG